MDVDKNCRGRTFQYNGCGGKVESGDCVSCPIYIVFDAARGMSPTYASRPPHAAAQKCDQHRVRMEIREHGPASTCPAFPTSMRLCIPPQHFLFRMLYKSVPNRFKHVISLYARPLSTKASLRRSYLYVPSSSERMLEKSIGTGSDVLIYDLEDSVSPQSIDKAAARSRLGKFLKVCPVAPVFGISTYFYTLTTCRSAVIS